MSFKNLLPYEKSFELAMSIFEMSKQFPKEERYSLTDQIRRSSRSVSVNIAEAYRKRIYPKHFVSKLTDADGENSETSTWLDFTLQCGYITVEKHQELISKNIEIGKLIHFMISNPQKFGVKLELE